MKLGNFENDGNRLTRNFGSQRVQMLSGEAPWLHHHTDLGNRPYPNFNRRTRINDALLVCQYLFLLSLNPHHLFFSP